MDWFRQALTGSLGRLRTASFRKRDDDDWDILDANLSPDLAARYRHHAGAVGNPDASPSDEISEDPRLARRQYGFLATEGFVPSESHDSMPTARATRAVRASVVPPPARIPIRSFSSRLPSIPRSTKSTDVLRHSTRRNVSLRATRSSAHLRPPEIPPCHVGRSASAVLPSASQVDLPTTPNVPSESSKPSTPTLAAIRQDAEQCRVELGMIDLRADPPRPRQSTSNGQRELAALGRMRGIVRSMISRCQLASEAHQEEIRYQGRRIPFIELDQDGMELLEAEGFELGTLMNDLIRLKVTINKLYGLLGVRLATNREDLANEVEEELGAHCVRTATEVSMKRIKFARHLRGLEYADMG